MKKICFILAMISILSMLCGCGRYAKSYSAMFLITSCHGDEASMEFDSFRGKYNFRLKGEKEGTRVLDYEASLTEGEMNVYIDANGKKELLFTVRGGESYDETLDLKEKYGNERTVCIILESVGKCKDGDFEFRYR